MGGEAGGLMIAKWGHWSAIFTHVPPSVCCAQGGDVGSRGISPVIPLIWRVLLPLGCPGP